MKPIWDNDVKRWKVETPYKTFWFNVEENAQKFIILWVAGDK